MQDAGVFLPKKYFLLIKILPSYSEVKIIVSDENYHQPHTEHTQNVDYNIIHNLNGACLAT